MESQPEATHTPLPLQPQGWGGVLTQIPAYFDGVPLQDILGFPWESLKGYTTTESLVTMPQATDSVSKVRSHSRGGDLILSSAFRTVSGTAATLMEGVNLG